VKTSLFFPIMFHLIDYWKVLSEARHHLINVCKASASEINMDDIYTGEQPQPNKLEGHLFAPVKY